MDTFRVRVGAVPQEAAGIRSQRAFCRATIASAANAVPAARACSTVVPIAATRRRARKKKASHSLMTICCSRALSERIGLDL